MGWDKQKKTSISVKCQDYVVRSEKSQREVMGGSGKVENRRNLFENIARIANAVQVTICLLVSTNNY